MDAKPDFQDLLAGLGASLVAELEQIYCPRDLPAIVIAATFIDSFLRDKVVDLLLENADYIWPGAKERADRDILQIGEYDYEIRISENILQYDLIEIAVLQRGILQPIATGTWSEELPLSGSGRYTKLKCFFPDSMSMQHNRACSLITTVFEIGYRWLREALLKTVSQHQKLLADDLYSLVRTFAPNEELIDGLWFAVGAKEGGFYVLDTRAAETALRIVGRSQASLSEGSSRLVAEFVSALFPEEQTFAGTAIRNRLSHIIAELPKASYAKTLSMVSEAEIAIYASDVVIVYPVVETMPYLVAVFPKEKRDSIIPFLEQHRADFSRAFLRSRDRLKTFAKSLLAPRQTLDFGKIGEFLGGLAKPYIMPDNR